MIVTFQCNKLVKLLKITLTKIRKEKCQMNIDAIPNNMEKYMAFMLVII